MNGNNEVVIHDKPLFTQNPNLGLWGYVPGVTTAIASVKVLSGVGSIVGSVAKIANIFLTFMWNKCIPQRMKPKGLEDREVTLLDACAQESWNIKNHADLIAANLLYAIPFAGYHMQKLLNSVGEATTSYVRDVKLISEFESKCKSYDEKILALQENSKRFQEQASAAKAGKDLLEKQISEKQSEITKTKEEMAALTIQINSLLEKLANIHTQPPVTPPPVTLPSPATPKVPTPSLPTPIDTHQDQANQDRLAAEAKIQELIDAQKALQSQIANLLSEKDDLVHSVAEANTKLTSAQQENHSLNDDIEKMTEERNNFHNELILLRAERHKKVK